METAEARVRSICVHVRAHVFKVIPLTIRPLSQNFDHVIGDAVAPLINGMHHELLPTLHRFLRPFTENVPEELLDFSFYSGRPAPGIDQHFCQGSGAILPSPLQPCIVGFAAWFTYL